LNHLPHGITIAIPQVVKALFLWFKSQDVGLCQVDNVNVIPDARPIRGRIIRPINLTMGALAERDFG